MLQYQTNTTRTNRMIASDCRAYADEIKEETPELAKSFMYWGTRSAGTGTPNGCTYPVAMNTEESE